MTQGTKLGWIMTLRGALAVLFGLIALIWPGITLTALVLALATYIMFDGLFAAAAAVHAADEGKPWRRLFQHGMVGIAIGLAAGFWPHTAALALIYGGACWAILAGAFQIIVALEQHCNHFAAGWMSGSAGVGAIVCGLLLAAFPQVATMAIAWLVGGYALFFGLLQLAGAAHLYQRQRRIAYRHVHVHNAG